jgi:ankyrin repeat protein
VIVLELLEIPAMASDLERVFDAVRTGDARVLSELIAESPSLAASKGQDGVSLLLTACYYRRPEIVEMILASAGPMDIFEASAVAGGTERVAALLEGAPSLAETYSADGFTPLHLASYFGREAAALALLNCGADPNAVSRNPMSLRPLHSAAVSRSLGIVKALVAHGALVNAVQHGGWTPLHAAAFNGDLPMAQFLVAHGADLSLKSDDGKTALDIAAEKGHGPVADWLRSAMAASHQ